MRVADKKTARENPEGGWKQSEAEGKGTWRFGRILVRESGTEPLIRVMVEAETDELCHQYVDKCCGSNGSRRTDRWLRNENQKNSINIDSGHGAFPSGWL